MPRLHLRLPDGLRRRLPPVDGASSRRALRSSSDSLAWHLLQYLLILLAARMVGDSLPAPSPRCRGRPEETEFCAYAAIEHTKRVDAYLPN